jgi:tetratricopeptide (TPR) repeat protein
MQAQLHESLGDSHAALDLLNAALDGRPDAIDLRLHRVDILFYTLSDKNAADDLDYLRSHHSYDPRTWHRYGLYQEFFEAHEDAVIAYTTGLDLDARNVELLRGRSAALQKLGRIAEALADIDRLIAVQPNDRLAYIKRAELELTMRQPERVIADIERVRSFGEAAVDDTSFILAQAQLMLGLRREALASLDAALASPNMQAMPEEQEKALALRLELLEELDKKTPTRDSVTALLEAMDQNQLMRIQVFFRNMGRQDISITGELDDATRAAFAECISEPSCNEAIDTI